MNKEERQAYNKVYYQDYLKEMKVQQKAYRRAYYLANKEKIRRRNEAWCKSNPEKHRDKSRRRRVLERTTEVEPINDKIVYLRDGWICQICKKRVDKRFKFPNPMSASLDHIVPLSESGTHTYDNVQLAHLSCNISKQNSILPQGEQRRLF